MDRPTAIQQLSEYITGRGLRSTSQRDIIVTAFIEAGQHLSADELYSRVKKINPRIGYATVYRTLRLLSEAGFVEGRRFEDGFTRFEYRNKDAHHDHLICTGCGVVIEFENKRIEELQHDVAKKNRFKVQNHKLELYGLCSACCEKARRSKGKMKKT